MGTGMQRVTTHELAWVVAVLDEMPAVDVLSVRAGKDTFEVEDDRVTMVSIDVHARTWEDAVLLTTALRLREIDGHESDSYYGQLIWRSWCGWVPEASREEPVQVTVTASELEQELPALLDGFDAFSKHRRTPEGVA